MTSFHTRLLRTATPALFALALAALALPAAHAETAQQQRMGQCATQNKGKHGDAYKQAMSTCLKAGPATAAKPATPQQRMKSCNADASSKKLAGDARKAFMKTCLASH
jgi:hypothetical protein